MGKIYGESREGDKKKNPKRVRVEDTKEIISS
jgi:hypothetical protein